MTRQKNFISYLFTIAFLATGLIFAQPISAATSVETHQTETVSQTEEHTTEAATDESHETDSEATHEEVDPGLLGLLGINWKLFIAQLINFAIVLFVLWKWVFKPVSSGLEARTAKIEKSLQDATSVDQAKKEFEDWKQAAMSAARSEAAQIVSDAKTEALVVKKQVIDETKSEQERVITAAKHQLEQERIQTVLDVKAQMADLVVSATQKILGDKLDSPKDKELIKQSLKGL